MIAGVILRILFELGGFDCEPRERAQRHLDFQFTFFCNLLRCSIPNLNTSMEKKRVLYIL